MNSAKICIIGAEVTNGFILDRNGQFFAQELAKLGVSVSETRVIRLTYEIPADYTAACLSGATMRTKSPDW